MKLENYPPEPGLYIHIPFCLKRCNYCAFVSNTGFYAEDVDNYLDALEMEMGLWKTCPVSTVYVGGGTPSVLSGIQMRRLCDTIRERFSFQPGVTEWSVEMNPESTALEKIKILLDSGVNRISLGCQSMEDETLTELGRPHTSEQFMQVYEMAREAGCKNLNIDLMYGLPGQSVSAWRRSVEKAIELEPEHISIYALTLERKTLFWKENLEHETFLPDSASVEKMYQTGIKILSERGYEAYEISNFSRAGYECRYNLSNWKGNPYIGVGIAAHGDIDGTRYENYSRFEEYFRCTSGHLKPRKEEEQPDFNARKLETLLLRLRLAEGISFAYWKKRFGDDIRVERKKKIEFLVKEKHLQTTRTHLRVPETVRMRLDWIIRELS